MSVTELYNVPHFADIPAEPLTIRERLRQSAFCQSVKILKIDCMNNRAGERGKEASDAPSNPKLV